MNGLAQNGLSTNGLIQNGFWQNGFWQNGFWQNGFWQNGFWQNGFWQNGFWQNGFWQNGFWQNGFWQNGFWQNGLTGVAAIPGETLRTSPYTRELLQYIYSCAMPAGTYDTFIDPNVDANGNGSIVCSTSDAGAAGADGGASCDVGYECQSGKCVVPLRGAGANGSGLAVNADGTTWWGSGTCDESCQRWVSACVLARTNAYGVHVEISLRAPADAPQAVKDALAVSAVERNGVDAGAGSPNSIAAFSLREGAYYGNIFATTPVNPSPSPTAGPDVGVVGYTGQEPGPIASTPSYYACAGPGSNIPEITKRFCSSQGDQVVINVPGVCLATNTQPGACAGEDQDANSPTFGAIQDCYTSTNKTGTPYQQVITVYLREPIAVCGNAVCEVGEDGTTCPSDCHPGTWAKDLVDLSGGIGNQPGGSTANSAALRSSAIAPDDSVVVTGGAAGDIDLGGGLLSADPGFGVLAKFGPDGTYRWGLRFGNTPPISVSDILQRVSGLTVATNGNITIAMLTDITNGQSVWLSTYLADDTLVGTWRIVTADYIASSRAIATDSQGNVIVVGSYVGNATFATQPPTSITSVDYTGTPTWRSDMFIAKVSPQGVVLWVRSQGLSGLSLAPQYVAIDQADDIVVVNEQYDRQADFVSYLQTFSPDGSVSWGKYLDPDRKYTGLAVDAGSIYVGGSSTSAGGIPNPPVLEKFGSDGSFQWASSPNVSCPPNVPSCRYFEVQAPDIAFNRAGDVIVASFGDPAVGGDIDFGTGPFPTYHSNNIFLSAYDPGTGQPKWAKQIPLIVNGDLFGMSVDSHDRVVVSGSYSGSMQADGQLLVTPVPEQPNVLHSFVSSFGPPSLLDATPPVIGAGPVNTDGTPILTVPQDITAQATSAQGAVVFFMPPTAIDTGNSGTSVACSPPPNTMFPVGATVVTCSARDPVGNTCSLTSPGCTAQATFTVTVVDTVGPVFSPVADVPPVLKTSANGATVSFSTPTATDQVDGAESVTCAPASGTTFPVGVTTVKCTAADSRNNQSSVSFKVTVNLLPYGASCATSSDCGAATCVDGVCCKTTACGACHACNVPGSEGTCAPTSGGQCDDHNACTQVDTCQSGACVGTMPVTCSSGDQCHGAGTCDPSTGACSNPSAPNGTACSDGDACTQSDTCQSGVCTGTNPVTCTASDQCHVAGTCDPSNGACSNPPVQNGTPCNDGNACTQTDACQTGVCTGTNPVVCSTGTCNTSTGACASPPTLNPGRNQTVVGDCSSTAVTYIYPTVATGDNATVTCTSIPSNSYGVHTVTCTATNSAGTSSPVSFTVSVLQPLTIKIQAPLSGDNDAVDNIVKDGSIVPNKILLYACGTDVTKTAAVVAKLGVTYKTTGGTSTTSVVPTNNGIGDSNGVMVFDGTYYHYNLSTRGFSSTNGVPAFYQETISVAYQSAPTVVVGTDLIQVDTK
jgi:hypothetical protein